MMKNENESENEIKYNKTESNFIVVINKRL